MSVLIGSNDGAGSTPAASLVPLPEAAETTSVEDEMAMFGGECMFSEYDDAAKQWRTSGWSRVNIYLAPSGQARLVVRQNGNLRLLLDAKLFPEMAVTAMNDGKGVMFQCINHAHDTASPASEAPLLATFALRFKDPEIAEAFKIRVDLFKDPVKKVFDEVYGPGHGFGESFAGTQTTSNMSGGAGAGAARGTRSGDDLKPTNGVFADTKACSTFALATSADLCSVRVPRSLDGGASTTSQVFGNDGGVASTPAYPSLTEADALLGEDAGMAMFVGDGVLYQMDAAMKWCKRGRGQVYVNRAFTGQVRIMVDKQDSKQVLLKVDLFPELTLTTFDDGKAVTFEGINLAQSAADKPAEPAEAKATETSSEARFAIRFKDAAEAANFVWMIDSEKMTPMKTFNMLWRD